MPGIDREDLEGPTIDRRTTMKLFGAAGMAAGLAGCSGGGGETTDSGGGGGGSTDAATDTEMSSDSSSSGGSTGGEITVGWLTDTIEFLDPHRVDKGTQIAVHSNLFNGLVKLDENNQIVGDLASDWELPDSSTYVFTLHEGATFHNGDTLDAEAVKASLDRLRNFDASEHKGKVTAIDSIETDGATELTINLSEPVAPFIAFMTRGPGRAGTIVHAEEAEANPDQYNQMPIGSGPFQLESREQGESLTLTAHDDYWETDSDGNSLPYLDQVNINLIPEPSTMWSAAQSGSVKYTSQITGSFAQQAENMSGLDVVTSSSGDWSCISFLANDPSEYPEGARYASGFDEITDKWSNTDLPTSNTKVRKALAMAIDREAVAQNAYFGYAVPAHTLYNPAIGWVYEGLGGEEPEPGQYYDPERAEELLDEAGFTGEPRIEGTMLALPEDEREVTVIQQQWSEIGVEIELSIQQQSSYWDRIYRYDTLMSTYGGSADIDPWMSHYKQLGSPDPDIGRGAWTKNMWLNEEYDEAIEAGKTTPNLDERIEHIRTANEIFVEEAPYGMTVFPLKPKVIASDLNGVGTQAGLSNFHSARLDG